MDQFLCIDIGGTNIKVSLCRKNGEIGEHRVYKTQEHQSFASLVEALHNDYKGHQFQSIGIGAPNLSGEKRAIHMAPNLPWPNVDLKAEFSKYFKQEIYCDNDANCFARAVSRFGVGKDFQSIAVLTIGTGLGSSFIDHGKIVRGQNGLAGEAGHILIEQNSKRICGCQAMGHAECFVSAPGLIQTAFDHGLKIESAKQLKDLADQKDQNAILAFDEFATHLGKTLSQLGTLFYPDIFVISGGVSNAHEYFLEKASQVMNDLIFPPFKDQIMVKTSILNEETCGILGALDCCLTGK